ncbi:sabinene synthase 1, chloroplastic-like [Salvia miltiorrhiza]|uniref:sabinene synthase 1, chloroplastic-like n=1 Tax=Salvia miltiorrhiza TaxID=226208 RepID=UPI0025AB93B5|nr:sabinene synthase 1, chloroplastic-like [Salvia miltiorrhiza]
MSISILQMAIPSSPAYNHLHKLHSSKSSKLSSSCLRLRCSSQLNADQLPIQRRSGNYSPSRWDVDYIQSLQSDYKEERHARRTSELIMQVKKMLEKETDPTRQLELIDELQRLGLSEHFHNEFKEILNSGYLENKYYKNGEIITQEAGKKNLYSTALAFRLLRQHGFQVAQEVFECFKNEEGEFKASLRDDTRGLLQLYEASFMLTEGENTLDIAREFATKILQEKLVNDEIDDNNLITWIRHSLEIPIHWSVERVNTSVWIDAYKRRDDMNPIVLELAILDSNIVQQLYQEELKQDLQWWKNTSLAEKLPFARDRLVECYFWSVGVVQPRQHGITRMAVAKSIALLTVIDDVYDVYGTLEELEQFTDVIRRWDMSSMEQLPSYMQLCFLALNNFINDTAYDVLKEQGINIIPYLRKSWTDMVEGFLVEAEWYHRGYKPSLEEYLNNGWMSSGNGVALTHAFFGVTTSLTKEIIHTFYGYHEIVRLSSMILRLADDLATFADEAHRGEVAKSIQCYMDDNNASEEEAREHMKWLIEETLKKMNKERVATDHPFSQDFIECALGMGKMAQYMYHYGDGHGRQQSIIHQQMGVCLFHPFA